MVFSASRPGALGLDMDKLARHFLPSVHALHVIPFDDHLAEGSEIGLDRLSRQTRQAFLELAGSVTDGFAALGAGRGASHGRI
jgi:MinD-like ATPase involved in chromosome partitioning or flagellar assembly